MTDGERCWGKDVTHRPCSGEVKFREHFKMWLCNRHHIDTMTIHGLNDALSKAYKKHFPGEKDRWQN